MQKLMYIPGNQIIRIIMYIVHVVDNRGDHYEQDVYALHAIVVLVCCHTVSSLSGGRQASLEFAAVSPAVSRSQSPALGISPMVRERVHSFDNRSLRSRLSLPPDSAATAARSSSSDRTRHRPTAVAHAESKSLNAVTATKLERSQKEPDIAGLLQASSHRRRDRSRSRSPGPPKTSRRRHNVVSDGRGQLERAQTLPDTLGGGDDPAASKLLPRPITITTGESPGLPLNVCHTWI